MDQDDDERERTKRATARYMTAMHGVQSGVAMLMNYEDGATAETSPKHLRVGVNSALVDAGALADLLIRKGVITRLEYAEALAEKAEQERASYEALVSSRVGAKVTLG